MNHEYWCKLIQTHWELHNYTRNRWIDNKKSLTWGEVTSTLRTMALMYRTVIHRTNDRLWWKIIKSWLKILAIKCLIGSQFILCGVIVVESIFITVLFVGKQEIKYQKPPSWRSLILILININPVTLSIGKQRLNIKLE